MARVYMKTPWSYETDCWVDVTTVNFRSKKFHEDIIVGQQDTLQFISEVSKNYEYVIKSPNDWPLTFRETREIIM